MRKLTMLALILIIAANTLSAQDRQCKRWPDRLQVIAADNVQQICSQGVNPGRIIEARWHKSEPILVLLYRASVDADQPSMPGFHVWDVENNVGRFGTGDWAFTQLELTPELIAIGTDRGTVMFWDLTQETYLYEVPVNEGEVTELLLHPSEELLVVAIDDAKLFRFDLESLTTAEIPFQNGNELPLHALAFSSDGRLFAAAGNGYVGIWDTDDWVAWEPIASFSASAVTLHFAKDDSQLILLADMSVSRWSLVDDGLELVRMLEPHLGATQCAFLGGGISPDTTLLMTTDECGQLRAWDLRSDHEIHVPQLWYIGEDHVGVPTSFSADGRYLVDRSEPYGFTWLIVPGDENSH